MKRNVSYLHSGLPPVLKQCRARGCLRGMKHPFSPFALCSTLLLSASVCTAAIDTTPTRELELGRYLGTWHETARLDNIFERGLHAVTALYERMADGRIRVTNSGTSADGERRNVMGVARQQENGSGGGDLEVTFVPPYTGFYSDYRILYVTPDYSGALVSDADGSMLWLLERDAESRPEVRERLLQEAQQRGFDTTELIYDEAAPASGDKASEAKVDTN